MTDEQASYRVMRADELPVVLDWAAAEGWNPGLDDARAFFAADPEGFFVAEIQDRPVAAISVVNHDAGFAFLGLYLCLPEYRGRGIGFGLWKHALAHAQGRCVGLDGVADQQANYARSGFVLAGSTTRHVGRLQAQAHPAIRAVQPGDMAAIRALDQRANGFSRPAFLDEWLAPIRSRRSVILAESGEIGGFATIRLCRAGAKIGPVIAPDAEAALALCRAALAELPADEVAIDLPVSAGTFSDLLISQGFQPGFTTARMYRGPAPAPGPELQAIATMELG